MMKRVLTFGLAAGCLLSVHCGADQTESKSSAPTAASEPSVSHPDVVMRSPGSRAPLLPIARIEGYGNPRTGELWARSVPAGATPARPSDGVQASAQALSGSTPGYCAVTVESDGEPNSNPAGTFEFYTKGQLEDAPIEDLSSFDPMTCYDNLQPAEQSPLVLSLFDTGLGVGCALQHVGNFSGVSYDHVYLDIDVFNGDEAMHGPYGPGYTTGTVDTPGGRNAPNVAKGLWDFGPMADTDIADMWIYFKNGDSTDFNWTGYLLGERTEDCSNAIDDDCDGVVNNGCALAGAGFLGGAECFANEDCNSAQCVGAVINSGFGKGGGDLSDDVPGYCMSAVGEACTINAGCQTNYCFGADTCVYPGELEFALIWEGTPSDFDLHVKAPPSGFEFYSGNLSGPDGQMDVHDCEGGVCRKPSGKHLEHVKLYPAPAGDFTYWVNNLDLAGGGSYTLQVLEGGAVVATHTGTLLAGQDGEVFTFRFPSACGDGVINTGEQCDAGPQGSDPGCDASCKIVAGYTCTGEPSVCDDGTMTCGSGPDTLMASQLVEAGHLCLSATQHPGQTFTVTGDGVLAGIEIGIDRCTMLETDFDDLRLEVKRAGAVIASATIPSSAVPANCASSVTMGSVGPTYFDLTADCAAVSASEQLEYVLSLVNPVTPACVGDVCQGGPSDGNSCLDDLDCGDLCLRAYLTTSAPYSGGEVIVDGSNFPTFDAVFKIFTRD